MSPTVWIVLLWLGFAGSHMVLSSVRLRPLLVEQLGELLTETQKLSAQPDLSLRTRLGRAASLMTAQVADTLTSTRNRVPLVVEELANQHRKLDIPATVLAMGAASFLGTQRGKLGFPVAERMWLDANDVRDLANFEEQLVRQLSAPCHCSSPCVFC